MYRSILVAASMFTSLPAYASPIAVSTEPAIPLVELTRTGQALNFDLLLVNSGAKTLEVEMLELSLRDATGQLVMQQRLGRTATRSKSFRIAPCRPSRGC